jgi:hypothetical protein
VSSFQPNCRILFEDGNRLGVRPKQVEDVAEQKAEQMAPADARDDARG